ncbi:MAG: hypothetical protein ACLFMW_04415, partial [Ectothiorhodospira sp.]
LVLLDPLQRAAAYDDIEAWMGTLEILEGAWFAPLRTRFRRGAPGRLHLHADGHTLGLGRGEAWHLWRPPHPLCGEGRP